MVRIVTMPVIWAILLVLAPAFATPLGDNSIKSSPCTLRWSQEGIIGGTHRVADDELPALKTKVNGILAGAEKETTQLSNIECATTQVVSGSLEKIQGIFKTADGSEKRCTIEIWSQSWLNSNEVKAIDCSLDRKRRTPDSEDGDTKLFERINEMIPHDEIERAKGQPLFTKASEILYATETLIENNRKFVVLGEFELPDDSTDFCRMTLLQQTNRLNVFTWNCENSGIEVIHSFYPSILSIPHSKRTREQNLFAKFMRNHNRDYARTEKEEQRFKIFVNNLQRIKLFNEMEQGSAKYGITEFADLTVEEYSKRNGLLYEDRLADSNHIGNPMADIPDIDELPRSFDWREKNAITGVKNQGSCGSCWAFSVTGNIEGLHAVQTGQLEEYSEQELLDCDTIDHACSGGLPDDAYKAIEQIGGLELEDEYPYKARKNKCSFNKTMSHVKVKGAIDLPKNETAMALWLVANGPISIGINANAMQFYRGGVSHPWRVLCRHGSLDHGVLIVGFGVDEFPVFNKTLPYWIVKNSWGKGWGEQGYYRVYRGDNTCGLSEMASSAVLDN